MSIVIDRNVIDPKVVLDRVAAEKRLADACERVAKRSRPEQLLSERGPATILTTSGNLMEVCVVLCTPTYMGYRDGSGKLCRMLFSDIACVDRD